MQRISRLFFHLGLALDMLALLAKARRPMIVAGGGGWDAQAVTDLKSFPQAFTLPVAASFRCQDLFDNTHDNYAGDLGLAAGQS